MRGMRMTLAAALVATILPTGAQAETLPPRDVCAADASFVAFRSTLADIVRRRDAKALLAITAPDIDYSLDPATPGRAGFVKEWGLNQPAGSKLWGELDTALSLGCARDPDQASIPYMFARLPQARDVFGTTISARPHVNLRASPNTDSAVVALLEWEILTILEEGPGDWTHVKTDDGKQGYVRNDFLRNPLAYRAIFRKLGGKWTMTTFINGD